MVKVEVDVDDQDLRRLERSMKSALDDTAKEVMDWATDTAEDDAQQTIRQHGRIWNREVLHGFESVERRMGNQSYYAKIWNNVPHANIVERGRRPGRAPQAQHIIEWVDDEVAVWQLNRDVGTPTLTEEELANDSNYDIHEVETSPAYTKEHDITEVTQNDPDVDGGVNEQAMRFVEFDDGTRGIFKPFEVTRSNHGVVENEKVFYEFARKFDWQKDGGFAPANFHTVENQDGSYTDGMIMHRIEDFEEAEDAIVDYYGSNNRIGISEFYKNNKEWNARVGILDYIIGNTDRHTSNYIVDANDQPWAIDNGGHSFNSDWWTSAYQRRNRLFVKDNAFRLNEVDQSGDYLVKNPEEVYNSAIDILDRQENFFKNILSDPDVRRELAEQFESYHGDESMWDGIFYEVLHPDSTSNKRLYGNPDADGKEFWEKDIDNLRDKLDEQIEMRVYDDHSYDGDEDIDEILRSDFSENLGFSTMNEMIRDVMGSLST